MKKMKLYKYTGIYISIDYGINFKEGIFLSLCDMGKGLPGKTKIFTNLTTILSILLPLININFLYLSFLFLFVSYGKFSFCIPFSPLKEDDVFEIYIKPNIHTLLEFGFRKNYNLYTIPNFKNKEILENINSEKELYFKVPFVEEFHKLVFTKDGIIKLTKISKNYIFKWHYIESTVYDYKEEIENKSSKVIIFTKEEFEEEVKNFLIK